MMALPIPLLAPVIIVTLFLNQSCYICILSIKSTFVGLLFTI